MRAGQRLLAVDEPGVPVEESALAGWAKECRSGSAIRKGERCAQSHKRLTMGLCAVCKAHVHGKVRSQHAAHHVMPKPGASLSIFKRRVPIS